MISAKVAVMYTLNLYGWRSRFKIPDQPQAKFCFLPQVGKLVLTLSDTPMLGLKGKLFTNKNMLYNKLKGTVARDKVFN